MESPVAALRTLPLFADLPREVLARLVGELEEVSILAGATVFMQREAGDAMYIVASGTLEVRYGEAGWEERLRAVGPGEWFGEMALLTGDRRSATVVALSNSRLWRLDKDRFLTLSDQYPTLLREVTRVLCRRLAWSAEHVGRARPDFVVALGMGVAWVLLGVAPARDAFAGFANSTWFLILGILALGAALGRSGLLYRITLLILRRCPPTFSGQALALGLAGAVSTLFVPSVQGRVTLFLTGKATCLLAWGMLPEATRAEITWGRWLLGVCRWRF